MTTIGTSHFVSVKAAIKYYRSQAEPDPAQAVADKLKEGAIHIGRPPISVTTGQHREFIIIIDNGTRYAIRSKN